MEKEGIWGHSQRLKLLWKQSNAKETMIPPQISWTSTYNLMFSQQLFWFLFFDFQQNPGDPIKEEEKEILFSLFGK